MVQDLFFNDVVANETSKLDSYPCQKTLACCLQERYSRFAENGAIVVGQALSMHPWIEGVDAMMHHFHFPKPYRQQKTVEFFRVLGDFSIFFLFHPWIISELDPECFSCPLFSNSPVGSGFGDRRVAPDQRKHLLAGARGTATQLRN